MIRRCITLKEFRVVITSRETGKKYFAKQHNGNVLTFSSCVLAYAIIRKCKTKLDTNKYEFSVVRTK